MTSFGRGQAIDNDNFRRGMASLTQGVCESVDWSTNLVIVNIGGGSIPMPMVANAPNVGAKVWIAYLGEQPVCLGPLPRATAGVIGSDTSGDGVDVLADDGVVYYLPWLGSLPAAGSRVAISWEARAIIGIVNSEVPPEIPVVPPAPDKAEKTFVFNPTDSGNWRTPSGPWQGTEVWCSSTNDGAYFYGTQIDDSIRSGEFVSGSLEIYIAEFFNQFPGSLATLALHSLTGKSGAPDMTNDINISAGSGWKQLPDAWEPLLRAGKRGVGTNQGGYHKFRPANVENSGVIRGRWRF